jgi:hypothetical protein
MAPYDNLELLAGKQRFVHGVAAVVRADRAGAGHSGSIAGPGSRRNREKGPVFAATTAGFRR